MFSSVKDTILKFITSRMTVIVLLLVVCAGALVYRLFDLQIVNGENYLNSFQLKIKKEKEERKKKKMRAQCIKRNLK